MSSLSVSEISAEQERDLSSPLDSDDSESDHLSFEEANDDDITESKKNALQLETSMEASSSTLSLTTALATTEMPTTPNSHTSGNSETATVKPDGTESPVTSEHRTMEDDGDRSRTKMETPNMDSFSTGDDKSAEKSPQSHRQMSSTASSFADSSADDTGTADGNRSSKNSDDGTSSQDRTSNTRPHHDESLKTSISSDMDYLAVWLKIEECLNR